ncbi:MAG TPA: DUF5667 domain-containing protein, partial [Pilimelia sp.]|nr:DUF5667 domain-containing protein [Pilimelia sp.]
MNTTLFHRRRAERFAQLLDEANGARRHHVRTGLDEQLAELVAIGHQVAAMPPPAVEPDPEFRSSLRAMLVATAERDGIGATALPAADTPAAPAVRRPGTRRAPRAGLSAAAPNRLRTRGAILIGIAAGAIAVSGMSAASTNAIPGDALYTVKRSTERAQLALASSDVTRGQLHLDFAQSRVAEAAAVRGESSGFAAVLNDMDADTVHGSRLLHSSAVTRRDPAALDAVEAFVTGQQRSLGTMLDGASAADRARTLKSLSLLDAIGKRAESLRGTLSCGTAPSMGADRLGPKPRSCTVGAAPAA